MAWRRPFRPTQLKLFPNTSKINHALTPIVYLKKFPPHELTHMHDTHMHTQIVAE